MSTIVRFFQDGGPFMYPILLVFAVGTAIAVERWLYLTMSGASNRSLWNKIVPFLKAGKFRRGGETHGQLESRHRFGPDVWALPRQVGTPT